MLKHDIDSSLMDNHFNFLQAVHEDSDFAGDENTGVRQVYNGHVKGYAGRFTQGTVNRIREMPEVSYVEKDSVVKASELDVQRNVPWVSFLVFT
jgi:cerevisin